MRVDKLTMANAVEARVPFLDHELVELAMAVPREEKIRDGIGKHVLKRAVSGLLDDDLMWRPKQGFGTPVSEWFRGELGDQLEQQLATARSTRPAGSTRDRIKTLLDLHRSRARRALVSAVERDQPVGVVRPLDRRRGAALAHDALLVVVGARPNFVKVAPVIAALADGARSRPTCCTPGSTTTG